MKLKKIIYFSVPAVFFAFIFAVSNSAAGEADFPRIKIQEEDIDVPEDKELILDVYTVQKTDSLAKIARRKYGDWRKWKIIYEYNDYIVEPHWIFPGDKIIVPTIVEKLPEVPEVETEEVEVEVEEVQEPREYKDFLAPEDFIFDASIVDFRDDKKMYAQGDYCFIDMGFADGIEEGQKFNIYRFKRGVVQPQTGEIMGMLMQKTGELKVTGDVEERSSTARITESKILIKQGDKLLLAE